MPKVCPVCGTSYGDTNVFCPADGSTLRAADADGDLIGTVVADRYLVTDLLGEGGMGKVYLARHVRLPQQAAIKVLRPEMLKDPAAIARFNREAANACRIEHERVARVFDFGETGEGLVYLAMEYVAGSALKEILQQEGPLPLARTAVIVRQIADGLDAAHRLGIVHRDLKPDNILVTRDEVDGTDRCKVVDFGIAKAMGGNEKESGLTKTGFVVGTPEFMSPEQLLGTDLDQRSDVYALALVAYQCLTCDLPFDTNTPDRGMTARLMSAPRTLEMVKPDAVWPAALQGVFDAALQKDAAQRTATAGAFARAFEAAVTPVAAPVAVTPASAPSIAPVAPMPTPAASPATPPARPAAAPTPAPAATGGGASKLLLAGVPVVAIAAAGLWFAFGGKGDETANTTAPVPAPEAAAAPVSQPAAVAEAPPQPADLSTEPTSSPSGSTGSSASPAPTPAVAAATGKPAAKPSAAERMADGSAGAVSPTAQAARKTLDSITSTLDPTESDEGAARAAIPVLRSILSRLPSGTDSTWAYIRMAEAHLVMSEAKPACTALRAAKATARTMNQAEVINRYTGMLGCGQ